MQRYQLLLPLVSGLLLSFLSIQTSHAQTFSATAIINGDTVAVDSANGTVIIERVPHGGHSHTHFDRRYGFYLSNGHRIELRDQMHPRKTGELLLGPAEAPSGAQYGACIYYKADGTELRDSEYIAEKPGTPAGKIAITETEVVTIEGEKHFLVSGHVDATVETFDMQAALNDGQVAPHEELEKAHVRVEFAHVRLNVLEEE